MRETVAHYVCDRCRKDVYVDPKVTPVGWRRVKADPVGVDGTADSREWEVCGACYSQMTRLLENTKAPEGLASTAA
jgi:hypothetical protein